MKTQTLTNHFYVLAASAILATIAILDVYFILRFAGLESHLNLIDRSKWVDWLQPGFFPKNYSKFIFNISLIMVPLITILLTSVQSKIKIRGCTPFWVAAASAFAFMRWAYFDSGLDWKRIVVVNGCIFAAYGVALSVDKWFYRTASNHEHQSELALALTEETMAPSSKTIPATQKITAWVGKYQMLFLVPLLLIVLINFAYKYSTGIWINYYHQNFLIAPINDMLHGKYFLVNTFSQYGMFYPVMLFSIFYAKLLKFTYMNFYLLLMVFSVVYFLVLYYFIRSITKNIIFAFIALILAMGINTLFNHAYFPYSENYDWPGAIALRFLFDGLIFWLIARNRYFQTKYLNWVIPFLVSFTLYYNLETGICITAAYSALCFLHVLNTSERINKKFIFLAKKVLALIAGIVSLYLAIAIFTWLRIGIMPDFNLMFGMPLMMTLEGYAAWPTPLVGWYWAYLILYFSILVSVIYCVLRLRGVRWKWIVLGAYSVYGLFLFHYYLNKSVSSNLPVVGIPFGILLVVVTEEMIVFLKHRQKSNRPLFLIIITSLCFLTCVTLFARTTYFLVKKLNYRLYSTGQLRLLKKYKNNNGIAVSYSLPKGLMAEDVFESAARIKELTKWQERIFLISRHDTVHLVMAEKTNYISFPMLEQVFLKEQVESLKKELIEDPRKPQYLFTDRGFPLSPIVAPPSPSAYDVLKDIFNAVAPYYELFEQVGVINIYKLKQGGESKIETAQAGETMNLRKSAGIKIPSNLPARASLFDNRKNQFFDIRVSEDGRTYDFVTKRFITGQDYNTVQGLNGFAFAFQGGGEGINLMPLNLRGKFTVEMLICPAKTQKPFAVIVGNLPGSENFRGFVVSQDGSPDPTSYFLSYGNGKSWLNTQMRFKLAPEMWHYLTVVMDMTDRKKITIVDNGKVIAVAPTGKDTLKNSDMPVKIANWASLDRPFNGIIEEVALTSNAIDLAEVKKKWASIKKSFNLP